MTDNIRLKFLQDVDTPKGPGNFIAYIQPNINLYAGADRCQITRWTTRDGKRICGNEIYPISSIKARKMDTPRKPKPEPKIQVVDVAFI
jgi:hypothetical protein